MDIQDSRIDESHTRTPSQMILMIIGGHLVSITA